MEKLKFDRKCKCDWCGQIEICAVNHYGTTIYNRLVCVECAISINQNDIALNGGAYFDLNNSTIIFSGENFIDCTKDYEEEENEDE